MSFELRRTEYPAMRLWRAEIKAGLDGQDPADPATWHRDALSRAAMHERDAFDLNDYGEFDAADAAIRKARLAFVGGESAPDSHYRRALDARARERLGEAAAEALALRSRPHRRIRLSPSDFMEMLGEHFHRVTRRRRRDVA